MLSPLLLAIWLLVHAIGNVDGQWRRRASRSPLCSTQSWHLEVGTVAEDPGVAGEAPEGCSPTSPAAGLGPIPSSAQCGAAPSTRSATSTGGRSQSKRICGHSCCSLWVTGGRPRGFSLNLHLLEDLFSSQGKPVHLPRQAGEGQRVQEGVQRIDAVGRVEE
ncbi:UNVERIFIED_CONTAM: hypothetical protein K2H54_075211 [Gekko kuhli]